MPDLIETYSLATGLRIDKPVPFENFCPLPGYKYIIVNASSGMAAKNYDYFNDVIRMMRPLAEEAGYEFVQIGMAEDIPLANVKHLQGLTTISQMMFLIKHSSLVIGNDSSAVHIASGYDVPLVAVYGSTHPKIHGPHFGTSKHQTLIESHRNGNKPSYSAVEDPKTVNFIHPEEVANRALQLLRIPYQVSEETIYIGNKYHTTTIELVVDQVLSPNDFQGIILNVRLDYHFDEGNLYQNLSHHKLCIITDRPFDVNIIKQFRENVALVVYLLKEGYDVKFAEQLRAVGIPMTFSTELEGEALAQLRLDFFDFSNIAVAKKFTKSDIENNDKISKNTLYRSSRYILSAGKIYLNKKDWKNDQPRLNQADNEGTIDDSPEFWEDLEYLRIYNN